MPKKNITLSLSVDLIRRLDKLEAVSGIKKSRFTEIALNEKLLEVEDMHEKHKKNMHTENRELKAKLTKLENMWREKYTS